MLSGHDLCCEQIEKWNSRNRSNTSMSLISLTLGLLRWENRNIPSTIGAPSCLVASVVRQIFEMVDHLQLLLSDIALNFRHTVHFENSCHFHIIIIFLNRWYFCMKHSLKAATIFLSFSFKNVHLYLYILRLLPLTSVSLNKF